MYARLILLAGLFALSCTAYADPMYPVYPLTGTSVTGYLFFASDPTTNYFNACRQSTFQQCDGPVTPGDASGFTYVFAGQGNYNFLYRGNGGSYLYLAQIIITGQITIDALCFSAPCTSPAYTMKFTDSAYTAPLVSTTNNLGLTESFSGNTVSLFYPGGTLNTTSGGTIESTFIRNAAISSTPEPSSFALLATGVLGISGILRRRIFPGSGCFRTH